MRECVSSRQRFRSNCPVNAALHRPCSWLSPPLAFGSSLYLFSPPATQCYSISVFVVNTLARFPCFFTLASTFAFCLWLVHAQGATDSNCLGGHQTRPPLPFSPSLSVRSFIIVEPMNTSFSTSLHVSAPFIVPTFLSFLQFPRISRALVFHFTWIKSVIILIQLSTIFSPLFTDRVLLFTACYLLIDNSIFHCRSDKNYLASMNGSKTDIFNIVIILIIY